MNPQEIDKLRLELSRIRDLKIRLKAEARRLRSEAAMRERDAERTDAVRDKLLDQLSAARR